MSQTLFISDLHLSPERPEIIELFLKFLDDKGRTAKRLYILGDFVEYWLGDDDKAIGLEPSFNKLKQLADAGVEIYLMHGNRDFLMGEQLAERCGCSLIADPCIVPFDGTPVLLMHGDTLCTDDVEYQKLRIMLRNPAWQQDFLSKPLAERIMMAKALRERSEQETQNKSAEIMDVNPAAVQQAFAQHQVNLLIHGHTHRPAIHHKDYGGKPCTRIVLGDWYKKGSYLVFNSVNDYALHEYP
ncbi:MAG: UDP-2,3-diacylglucosamine diphosphatase [Gammaproteobacteria bacterium]|nr:MAG: UDP-2,3-diacylglucosamine diphosphatase [Gammaproteobacteria bacterium]